MNQIKASGKFASAAVFFVLLFASFACSQAQTPVVNPPHPANGTVIFFANYKKTNGKTNSDWKAMSLALQACQKTHAAVLNIPTGTYHFNDSALLSTSGGHIQLVGLSDLTIDGHGSVFLFHFVRNGFDFTDCQRLLLQNITFEWDFDIAAPGVVAQGTNGNVIQVNAAYPITKATPVGAVTAYDTAAGQMQMSGMTEVYNPKNVTLVAPQTLASPDFSFFPVGTTVAVREYVYAANGCEFSDASDADLTFRKLTVENCPGMVFHSGYADRGFEFDGCVVARRNTTHDLYSTGADAIHIGMSHGDTIIQNCNFSYLGDDAVNIHGIWMTVEALPTTSEVEVASVYYNPNDVAVGDTLQFIAADQLTPLAQAHVTAVSLDPASQTYTLSLDAALPASVAVGGHVANLARASDRYLLKGNTLHEIRSRCFLVQSSSGTIDGNHFGRITGAALQLTTEIYAWHEGFGCQNVTITNNFCDTCNQGYWGGFDNLSGICMGVINIETQVPSSGGQGNLGTAAVHQNITISGNTVQNTPDIAFFIGSAANVSLTGNTIQNCPASAWRGICVAEASQIAITGNQAVNCSYAPGQGIYADAATTEAVTSSGNSGF